MRVVHPYVVRLLHSSMTGNSVCVPPANSWPLAMHVLVLDRDYTNVMAHAIQLSGYGLVVETVQDIEAVALRLSTIKFDAVLCNLDFSNASHRARLLQFQESYPNTAFYTRERIGEFLRELKLTIHTEGDD